MTVARILGDKGRDVFTTQPHCTLKEVVELLAAKGVGAVVVSDASRSVLGILSERDVVRVIARDGAAALEDPVSRHMTPKVITVTVDDTIDHVMQTMTAGRFRHIPVVEERSPDRHHLHRRRRQAPRQRARQRAAGFARIYRDRLSRAGGSPTAQKPRPEGRLESRPAI